MKKASVFISGIFILFLSLSVNAQSKTGASYFSGKWSVLVKGTPNGDSKMIFVLEQKDSTMTGVVQDSTGLEMTKITNVELKETTITIYFTMSGYDLNLVMDKKDEDHITGTLFNMFEAEGVRIKPLK